ncbi:MAG: 16S rRNA (cytosine(1402)-N(4))-methyltransferase RsmH [Calditrichaeota bacterium]|nr:16S rRNA (cytosine(1402)-N(4))-methyltransferase RsmH [Calditrichota bacterium]MCB9368501.1 16S rRNA (cytosine(1402)-N(4))-methyltransferase RsmH [Calditrichota bacterium]
MNSPNTYHVPVMGKEVVQWLVSDPNGTYADFTVGGGGHSRLIWSQLGESGRVVGIDRDPDAIAEARPTLPENNDLWNIRFSETLSKFFPLYGSVFSGILMDLGVSSHQLDEGARGFSYRDDGPLDLRMSQKGETAAELLAGLDEKSLKDMLKSLGEEPQSARIAKAIVRSRTEEPITRTAQLAEIIRKSVPATARKSLPRVFQALRMAVNSELEELESGLEAAWQLLKPSGRLVVLTYHSLEDRPVKQFMQSKAKPVTPPLTDLLAPPPRPTGSYPVRGPLLPTPEEIADNPRSRSAKLRVIEKIS